MRSLGLVYPFLDHSILSSRTTRQSVDFRWLLVLVNVVGVRLLHARSSFISGPADCKRIKVEAPNLR